MHLQFCCLACQEEKVKRLLVVVAYILCQEEKSEKLLVAVIVASTVGVTIVIVLACLW